MPSAKKKETYSQAISRLEQIVSQIDNNELDIDQLADKIKEANGLPDRQQRTGHRPAGRQNQGSQRPHRLLPKQIDESGR